MGPGEGPPQDLDTPGFPRYLAAPQSRSEDVRLAARLGEQLKTLLIASAAVLALVAVGPAAARTESAPALERLLVGFERTPAASERAHVAREGGQVLKAIPEANALAVRMNPRAAERLVARGIASYVEADELRYPLSLASAELAPSLSNGLYGLVTTRATEVHSVGRSGAGIKACVADSGVDYTHPDIAPRYRAGIDEVSNDFNPSWGGDVHETHGTHVAGTVLAARGNDQGVYGVAYGADLYYARVLGYNPATGLVQGSSSDIMGGVRWLVDQGCKVVNLSLGGGRRMKTEERFYADMDKRGALVVAASGNDSATAVSYPAAYSTVLSVGAVDVNNARASFSNTGAGLDISAPGVLVLSSYPAGTGSESAVTAGSASYRSFGMEYAGKTSAAGVAGALVDCGLGLAGQCPAAVAGNVALIQRGSISFAEKVQNATSAGAAAAIVYNNAPGDFVGTLGDPGAWIPAVSVSDTSGAALRGAVGTTVTVVNLASSWEHSDGTSMATPHVSGVAALVWSVNPSMSDEAVEDHLKATAQDLGAAGYDTTFGYGLVNARAAVTRAGG